MAPSYRNPENLGLEEYVSVERKANGAVYYSYRLPNGKRQSLRRPLGASDSAYKKNANQTARKLSLQLGRDNTDDEAQYILNNYLMASSGIGKKESQIPELLTRFEKVFLPTRRHLQSTLDGKLTILAYYSNLWADLSIVDLTQHRLTEQLNSLCKNSKSNASYIKHRGLWIDIYKFAISEGFKVENIAQKTLLKRQGRTKRKRLKYEQYQAIHAAAPDYLKRVMDIGLLTLQRRGDLVEILKSDIYPANLMPEYEIHFNETQKGAEEVEFELIGYYWTHPASKERQLVAKGSFRKACDATVALNAQYGLTGPRNLIVIQNKTVKRGDKACLAIELDEHMEKAVSRCMASDIPTPFLIHHKPQLVKGNKKHWSYLAPNYLTKAFQDVRDSLEMFQGMPKDERPPFHEIRALGGKLYEEKYGAVKGKHIANMLFGHTNIKMTDHYLDGHKVEFTKAGINLSN